MIEIPIFISVLLYSTVLLYFWDFERKRLNTTNSQYAKKNRYVVYIHNFLFYSTINNIQKQLSQLNHYVFLNNASHINYMWFISGSCTVAIYST
jgi:MFS superfamily sulfate permease-like transporter